MNVVSILSDILSELKKEDGNIYITRCYPSKAFTVYILLNDEINVKLETLPCAIGVITQDEETTVFLPPAANKPELVHFLAARILNKIHALWND